MLIKRESECIQFTANDGCCIREVLHPKNDPIDLPFSFAIAEVAPRSSTYRHRLQQLEVYYILQGRGVVHVDDETRELTIGDAVYIPPKRVQWIENTGAELLRFAAIVAPPWQSESDERLVE
jgi:mannose-6-phosphate isomerase-like protein (cupin superfamily)